MEIQSVLFACIGAWVVCRLLVEPLVTRRAKARLAAGQTGGLGSVSLAQLGSRILLLASLSAGMAYGLTVWINAQDQMGLAETNVMLDRIAEARDRIAAFGTAWGMAATGAIAAGLALLTFQASKAKEKRIVSEVWNAEISRLQAAFERGEWDDLAPSPEMQQVQRNMDELAAAFEIAQARGDGQRAAAIRAAFEKLSEAQVFFDLRRRAEVHIAPETVGIKSKRSLPGWISAIFFSKGVVASLGTGTRILTAIGLLVLFPSLLAASYTAAEPALQASLDRIENRRAALAFEIEFAEIDQAYDAILTVPTVETVEVLDDETENAIAETAQVFEADILPRILVRSINVSGANLDDRVRSLETASARQKLLEIRAQSARGAQASVSGGVDTPDFHTLSSAEIPGSGTTRGELRRMAQSDPAAFARLRDNARALKHTFTTPAGTGQLQRALISQIVGHAAELAPAIDGLDPALDRQVRAWAAEIPTPDAARAREVVLKKWVVESQRQAQLDWSGLADWHHSPLSPSTGQSVGNALLEFERSLPQATRLADNLPSLSRAPRYNPGQAAQAVGQMAERLGNGSEGASFPARALTVFDDHFPGQAGAELATPQARSIQAISGSPPVPAARRATATASAATRARSYGRLRGFSRIGGVLIGREPEDTERQLAIDHFSWRRTGGRMELVMGLGNDRQTIGRFHPAIIHLALAYAADGRPTTVTMVTTDVVPDLRILLHPALEDTGLGCRAIRLDQLADEMSAVSNSPLAAVRSDAVERIHGEFGLYRMAWRARAATKLPTSGLSGDDLAYAREAVTSAESIPEHERIAAAGISGSVAMPLWIRRKPEFLDLSLVGQMEACLPSQSLAQFEICVAGNSGRASAGASGYAWLAPPPDYQVWSGVRELPFNLDTELGFLQPPGGQSVWPFRFMVQVAFESPAYFAGGATKWADERNTARDDYVDYDPWEISTVSESLSQAIEAEVGRNAQVSDIVSSMREFAILQRLFRTALDGRLGPDFPTDQLVALSEQTVSDVNPDALTAQWLRRPGEIEGQLFARTAAVAETLPSESAEDQFFSRVGDCMALIVDTVENNPTAEIALEAITADRWNRVCVFSNLSAFGSEGGAADLEEFSRIAAEIRNVRRSVGATAPEKVEYPSERGYCPEL
ncbi:hypothetical protein [Hyphomonas sp.]|uniref:hypothetical protein n=1 Tax=Hyphomonas sp. TaxID=87 RepID=UPI003D2CD38A